MSAFYDLASLVLVPSGYKAQKVYAQKPLTTDGQLTFSRASTATRVNSAGLIETVSSNVPRLDYLNSSCPRLLLEPQRTNLLTFSEQLDNATWLKTSGVTISANSAVSPDGYTNADVITWNGSNREVAQLVVLANGVFSFYAKGSGTIYVGIAGGTQSEVIFTLTADWSRIVVPYTGTSSYVYIGNYGGATATSVTVWGAQLEAGAYATSYIPTLGAAVTRGADGAIKTSASALIGQTEGTLFAEFDVTLGVSGGEYFLSDGTNVIAIQFPAASPNTIRAIIYNGGSFPVLMDYTYSTAGSHKVAYAYKANDFVLYVDGVQRASDTSGTVPACSIVQLGGAQNTASALVFKTRLTNAQLAELTAL